MGGLPSGSGPSSVGQPATPLQTSPPREVRDYPRVSEDQMDQVRDLLFGSLRREFETRLLRLESRVDEIDAQMKAMAGSVASDRRTSFDSLSRAVNDLGEQIRHISRT